MKIVKSSDPITVSAIITVLYGQPGTGKTSISGTAESALLLDFDRGSHRSAFRPDAVLVEHWNEVASFTDADLKGYSTVVVDTVGRALDFLAAAIPQNEGRTQLKRPSGGLTLQGYGRLKDDFTGWLKRLTTMGRDVILIAHDKEDKDGDARIIRPDITGGSYHEVVKVADFVGYVYKDSGRVTVLDFNPTDRWIGKNSAHFDPLRVPDFGEVPDWFAGVVRKAKESLGGISEAQRQAVSALDRYRQLVDQASTPEDFSNLIQDAQELGKPASLQAWNYLKRKALESGYDFDKASGVFLAAQTREAAA